MLRENPEVMQRTIRCIASYEYESKYSKLDVKALAVYRNDVKMRLRDRNDRSSVRSFLCA